MNALHSGDLLAGRYQIIDRIPTDLREVAVWSAQDRILDRPVRLSVVSGDHTVEALDSARRAALVQDPRLVRILDVGTADHVSYVVTEAIDGQTLSEIVAAGIVDPQQARAIVGEAATALERARQRGVHHLALRPGSITVDGSRVIITGLGVDAGAAGLNQRDADTTSRADAQGLVALLYYLMSARWPGPSLDALWIDPQAIQPLAARRREGTVVSLGEVRGDVPAELVALCDETFAGHDGSGARWDRPTAEGPATVGDLAARLRPWGEVSVVAALPAFVRPEPANGVNRQSVRTAFGSSTVPPGTPPPAPPVHRPAGRIHRPDPSVGAPAIVPPPGVGVGPGESIPPASAVTPAGSTDDGAPAPLPQPAQPPGLTSPAPTAQPTPLGDATTPTSPMQPTPLGDATTPTIVAPTASPVGGGPVAAQPAFPTVAAGGPGAGSGGAQAGPGVADAGPAGTGRTPTRNPTGIAHTAPPRVRPVPPPAQPAGFPPSDPATITLPGELPRQPVDQASRSTGAPDQAGSAKRRRGWFNPTAVILLIAVLALVGGVVWAVGNAFSGFKSPFESHDQSTQQESSTPSTDSSPAEGGDDGGASAAPVIASGQAVAAPGHQPDHTELENLAVDGDPSTDWYSSTYNSAQFGNLTDGLGYAIVLQDPAKVSAITLTTGNTGGHVEVRATTPDAPNGGEVLASGSLSATTEFRFDKPVEGQTFVLWFTELPQAADGGFRVELYNIAVS